MTRRTYRTAAIVLAVVALPACAGPTIWDKEGGTQGEFNKDSYRCVRESSTGVAYTGVSYGYGVRTVVGRPTQDAGMYRMCMNAAGYTQRGN